MRGIFEGCSSLSLLPDISKWKTNNASSMSNLFKRCLSLSLFPDISKWNTHKVTDWVNMFDEFINCLNNPNKYY